MTQRKLRKLLLSSIPFETERLIIRQVNINDAEDMYEYSSIPEVSEYLLWSPHLNIETTKGYIISLQSRYLKGLYGDWAIELKNSDKMIGTCGYAHLDLKEKNCEIGYVLSPFFRNKGYMSEAIDAMLHLTFDVMNLEKATLRIIRENTRSINLAEKKGFVLETSVYLEIKGEVKEVLHYTLTNDKFQKNKKEAVV
ncbi:MAG: GNAT family N-acetyltransferase [Ruminococcaceae bacterium]|nr:GNAT family N-acetyltransferase [Oscillospiraceae bacterium]